MASAMQQLEEYFDAIRERKEKIKRIEKEIEVLKTEKVSYFNSIIGKPEPAVMELSCKLDNSEDSIETREKKKNTPIEPCSKCGDTFSSIRGQSIHNRGCQGISPECAICGKKYSNNSTQRKHNYECERSVSRKKSSKKKAPHLEKDVEDEEEIEVEYQDEDEDDEEFYEEKSKDTDCIDVGNNIVFVSYPENPKDPEDFCF